MLAMSDKPVIWRRLVNGRVPKYGVTLPEVNSLSLNEMLINHRGLKSGETKGRSKCRQPTGPRGQSIVC